MQLGISQLVIGEIGKNRQELFIEKERVIPGHSLRAIAKKASSLLEMISCGTLKIPY